MDLSGRDPQRIQQPYGEVQTIKLQKNKITTKTKETKEEEENKKKENEDKKK